MYGDFKKIIPFRYRGTAWCSPSPETGRERAYFPFGIGSWPDDATRDRMLECHVIQAFTFRKYRAFQSFILCHGVNNDSNGVEYDACIARKYNLI